MGFLKVSLVILTDLLRKKKVSLSKKKKKSHFIKVVKEKTH